MRKCSRLIKNSLIYDLVIRGGVLEDTFWSPWPWSRRTSPWPRVLVNWPVLGSRTAVFFELLKFCEALEKFFGKRFFVEIAWKIFVKTFFFGEHLRLCPWPRECLSSERLSLALDFFCVLGLGSSLVSSTPPLLVILEKRSKSCLVFVTWIYSGNRLLRHLKGPWKKSVVESKLLLRR